MDSRLRGNDEERGGNDEERGGNDEERGGNDGRRSTLRQAQGERMGFGQGERGWGRKGERM